MFSLVSGVYDNYFAPTQLNVLVVGASGTGKTALLERMKVTEFPKKAKLPKEQPEELHVPESFLPVPLRVEQTPMQRQLSQQSIQKKMLQKKKQRAANNKSKKRGLLACPAPSRYSKANDSSSDEEDKEEEDDHDDDDDDDDVNEVPPQPNGIGRNSSMDISLQDVPIGDSERDVVNGKDQQCETIHEKRPEAEVVKDEEEEEDQEYDLKSKSRMLPLHKIRPTST